MQESQPGTPAESKTNSDAELLARFAAGDHDAFTAFVQEHADRCFRLAQHLSANLADAEDAVQNAFIQTFQNVQTFRPRSNARAWLCGILTNCCFELRRHEQSVKRRQWHATALCSRSEQGPSNDVEDQVAQELVLLDENERMILWLRFAEDMRFREIAQYLGMPQKTVESRIKRIITRIRENHRARERRQSFSSFALGWMVQCFQVESSSTQRATRICREIRVQHQGAGQPSPTQQNPFLTANTASRAGRSWRPILRAMVVGTGVVATMALSVWALLAGTNSSSASHARVCVPPAIEVPQLPPWLAMLPGDPSRPIPALSARHRANALARREIPKVTAEPTDITGKWPSGISLAWIHHHQQSDGCWDPSAATASVWSDAQKSGLAPWGGLDARLAATSLNLDAFLMAGYDHMAPSTFKKGILIGLSWLCAQEQDGTFSADLSIQGVVTATLCDAYGVTGDLTIKRVCERAVASILSRQNFEGGIPLGWPVTIADQPICDTDASLWCVSALTLAHEYGIETGKGLDGARRYVQLAWESANGPVPPHLNADYSTFPAQWDPRTKNCFLPHMPAAGLFMATHLGHLASDTLAETLANHACRKADLAKAQTGIIDDFLTTIDGYRLGGLRNQKENDAINTMLLQQCSNDASADRGSWDPSLFADGQMVGGRTLATAFATCTLIIHNRQRFAKNFDPPTLDHQHLLKDHPDLLPHLNMWAPSAWILPIEVNGYALLQQYQPLDQSVL